MRATALLLLVVTGCAPDVGTDAPESFVLNCAGWIDGFSKIGSETIQLGVRTYKTELRWDGAARELTTVDAEGPLAFCAAIPDEKCEARMHQDHLIADNVTSGPGKKPDSIVRTIEHIDVDLQSLKGVKDSEVLSGTIIDGKTAKTDMQIKQTAQLNCERT